MYEAALRFCPVCVVTFRTLSTFRCCPNNERRDNIKQIRSDSIFKSTKRLRCNKTSHQVWTGICPYSRPFMWSRRVQSNPWGQTNCDISETSISQQELRVTAAGMRSQGISHRTRGLKVCLRCLSKSRDAERDASLQRTSFFGSARSDWLEGDVFYVFVLLKTTAKRIQWEIVSCCESYL